MPLVYFREIILNNLKGKTNCSPVYLKKTIISSKKQTFAAHNPPSVFILFLFMLALFSPQDRELALKLTEANPL